MAIRIGSSNLKRIVVLLLSSESHRPYLVALKTKIYIDFFSSLLDEIGLNADATTPFKKILIDNQPDLDNKLWYSGINHKTVGDTYGSQGVPAKELALKEIGSNIRQIVRESKTSLKSITLEYNQGKIVTLNSEELLSLFLAISTRHASLKGGFASSFGKKVEKLFLITICKIFRVSDDNYYAYDIQDEEGFNRETDFYFVNNDKKFKCELKMMGKGNPEGADSLYARDTSIFIGETLSDTNKKQCEKNNVHWIELKNSGWKRFGEVFKKLGIKAEFDPDYEKKLDSILNSIIDNI
jgi:hypothetical protein